MNSLFLWYRACGSFFARYFLLQLHCLLFVGVLSEQLAAEVVFLPDTWSTIARDGTGASTVVDYSDIATFASPTHFVDTAVDGESTTTSGVFLRKNNQGAVLRNDYSMSRAGSPSSESFIIVRSRFTVSAPTSYSISGFFSASSPASLLNTYEVNADLRESATQSILFRNIQQTTNRQSDEFTLGLAEGNFQNQLQGSLSGMLQPGIEYQFTGTASIRNFSSVDPTGAATATGFVELSIGGVTVPEHSTIVLLMPLAAVLPFYRGPRSKVSGRNS